MRERDVDILRERKGQSHSESVQDWECDLRVPERRQVVLRNVFAAYFEKKNADVGVRAKKISK